MDSPTTPVEKLRPSFLVPHGQVWPSATNPRTRFDEASLKELAASMTPAVGIIEPLVVRAHPTKGGHYEIVAGERRWRAAKIAGLIEIPIIERHLDDAQVLDLQLIENKHRDDIHPLDEARAMERRIKLDRHLTPKGMAKFIGVSERYVQNRLRYLRLTPEVQKLFLDGKLTSGHADILIRLKPADQATAVKDGLFEHGHYSNDGDHRAPKQLRSTRDFDGWVKRNIRLALEAEGREEIQDRFPELAAVLADPAKPTLLELVDEYYLPKGIKALKSDEWKTVKKGQACEYQARGVIVVGANQGTVLTVCTGVGKCRKHFAWTIPEKDGGRQTNGGTYKRPAADIRKMKQQRLWSRMKKTAFAEAIKATPTTLTPGVRKVLAYGIESYHYRGGDLSVPDLVKMVIEHKGFLLDRQTFDSRIAKPLGLNLKKIETAAAPAPKKKIVVEKSLTKAMKKLRAAKGQKTTKRPFKHRASPKVKGGRKKR